ncbi:MAG: hypothetical protein ABSE73_24950, partial [Planctomycetota bacterium]
MNNDSGVTAGAAGSAAQSGPSGVGQTANIGRATSFGGGAAKVFREFKWGLLALFLLMAVVIGLVYDGGRKKKNATAEAGPKRLKPGLAVDDAYLVDLPREQWFEIRFKDEDLNAQLETVSERLKGQRKAFEKRFEEKKAKI